MLNHESHAAGRVDIHSHILPEVDDGARTLDESLTMLRMAASDGTRVMVATPHAQRVTPEIVRVGVEYLRSAASANGIDITILGGSEVRFSANLAEDYRAGKLITIDDAGYLLIEFPFGDEWPALVRSTLYALQLAGAMPIVAHAERYPAVQNDPSILVELAKLDIPIQINAGSLLGDEGETARQTAELLLKANLAHILASDGHRPDKRKPLLQSAYDRIEQLAGANQVALMQQNASRAIAGRSLNTPDPDLSALRSPSKVCGLLSRLRG